MTAGVSSPKAYTHPTPLKTLAPHLLPHLPESLPLLRRLQFHTSSPSARTIATFPSSSSPSSSSPPTFAATWTDRTRAPETECWIFSTYETLPSPPTPSQRQKEEAKAQCRALLAAIARLPATRTPLVVVGSLNEKLLGLIWGEEEVRRLVPRDVVSRHLKREDDDDDDDDGGDKGGGVRGVVNGISVPYCKWLIGPPSDRGTRDHEGEGGEGEGGGRGGGGGRRRSRENEDDTSGLPPGYAFGNLNTSGSGDELRLTMSRSAIPRAEKTLAELGNCCVRHRIPTSTSPSPTPHPHTTPHTNPPPPQNNNNNNEDEQAPPVAWAYLGADGSLTSLHVEPRHRNLGLAKAVTRRLLECLADDAAGMGFRDVDSVTVDGSDNDDDSDDNNSEGARNGEYGGGGKGWAHSDVAEGNVGSVGVARGLGGKEGWRVRWVGVDLGAVLGEEEEAEEEEERAVV